MNFSFYAKMGIYIIRLSIASPDAVTQVSGSCCRLWDTGLMRKVLSRGIQSREVPGPLKGQRTAARRTGTMGKREQCSLI